MSRYVKIENTMISSIEYFHKNNRCVCGTMLYCDIFFHSYLHYTTKKSLQMSGECFKYRFIHSIFAEINVGSFFIYICWKICGGEFDFSLFCSKIVSNTDLQFQLYPIWIHEWWYPVSFWMVAARISNKKTIFLLFPHSKFLMWNTRNQQIQLRIHYGPNFHPWNKKGGLCVQCVSKWWRHCWNKK